MLDPSAAKRLAAALVSTAGGYLRNPVRVDRVTCAVCTTPVNDFQRCFQCNRHVSSGLSDATAFLTYAVAGQQSGYVMRGYKARWPVGEHVWHFSVCDPLPNHSLSFCWTTPGPLEATPSRPPQRFTWPAQAECRYSS